LFALIVASQALVLSRLRRKGKEKKKIKDEDKA
jgi:hypothetical protein